MARKASKIERVHRVLDASLGGGPQLGADIGKVQAATWHRLGAVGYRDRRPERDGVWGMESADAAGDALYRLGATIATVKAARAGRLTVGAQRMIRYPGRRVEAQRDRERERHDEIRRRVRKANGAGGGHGSSSSTVSGQRKRATDACRFALAHAGRHYTQGSRRWDPIRSGASPVTGKMWSYGDCSSVATWVLWHALGRGGPDVVNGQDWQGGYTGTILEHGVAVTDGRYEPGDLCVFGGGTGAHVIVCYQAGTAATALWLSHGSAGGPYSVKMTYRGDMRRVRRVIGVG